MLKVENIRFGYVPSVDIFRNVTFTIEGGEYIAIGGRNGCGKTTITRLLVGLEKASEGRMYYNGTDITSMPPSKRGQFIGYVFQQPDRQMFRPTVATEVAFGPESLGRSKSEVKRIVDEVLERTGIAHLREAYPPTLRHGEKQRVAIAWWQSRRIIQEVYGRIARPRPYKTAKCGTFTGGTIPRLLQIHG